jgi:putative FmdB family regulatory protein
MPAYEYYCRKCDKTFTLHMSILDHNTERIQCPQCKGREVEQVMSSFVAVTSKKS